MCIRIYIYVFCAGRPLDTVVLTRPHISFHRLHDSCILISISISLSLPIVSKYMHLCKYKLHYVSESMIFHKTKVMHLVALRCDKSPTLQKLFQKYTYAVRSEKGKRISQAFFIFFHKTTFIIINVPKCSEDY